MNLVTICPCCSNPMLHHVNHHEEYWFCRECWQKMPNLSTVKNRSQHRIVNLSHTLAKINKAVLV